MLFGHLQDKKINALAVATQARLPDLPDVPTMIEGGFPDFVASSWTSVMAPAGTPKDIVAKLNESINAGLTYAADAGALQAARGRMPGPERRRSLRPSSRARSRKWQAMAKIAGITGE